MVHIAVKSKSVGRVRVGGRAGRGPTDPQRRQRIAAAAIEVVAERGIEGVTHREVARVAGVPLGSTTYHFVDRGEMLSAALELAAERTARRVKAWAEAIPEGADIVEALLDFAEAEASFGRGRVVLAYELYVAAMKRPGLQDAAARWAATLPAELERHTGPVRAGALGACIEGLMLTTMASGEPFDRARAAELLRSIADQPERAGALGER